MVGLDTNVLVRYLAQDDAQQSALATRLIESLTPARPGFVTLISLVESVWVMEDVYQATRDRVGDFIETLLQTEALIVQSSEAAWGALRAFRRGKADFADCLIERLCTAEGCATTWTFDKTAARDGGMKLLMASNAGK